MKDLFSDVADGYARFRPGYPDAVFAWLAGMVPHCGTAWDCGTGNGQVARVLAPIFDQVYATDISQEQLAQAPVLPNVTYSVQPAEGTSFPDNFFDLVVAAQAVHWFDFERFFAEVRRTSKSGGIVVAMGYGRIELDAPLNGLVDQLYSDTVGAYWDAERRYIDEGYRTIPFPFTEIEPPHFGNTYNWTAAQLLGYLHTWSAVQHYRKATGSDPVQAMAPSILAAWGNEERSVRFPLLLRVGVVE